MSTVVERFLICDGNCGENFGVDDRDQTIAEQRLRAKRNGWTFSGGQDFCPGCSKEKAALAKGGKV